jgi:hypothetical protein
VCHSLSKLRPIAEVMCRPALVATMAAAMLAHPGIAAPQATHDEPAVSEPTQKTPEQAIVVTGRRYDSAKSKREAIAYFRDDCFESNRVKRQSTAPKGDPDWLPLDDALRAKLNLDPDAPAYQLIDDARGYTLIFKIEQVQRPNQLVENRCTIIMVGGDDHSSLLNQMSALFRSPRYAGSVDGRGGLERTRPGWKHWLWTAMPSHGSRNWKQFRLGAASAHWIAVIDDNGFYAHYDYLLGDLKTKSASEPKISIMSFVFIHHVKFKWGERR